MDTYNDLQVNGRPFDEYNDIENRRCCLEWAMERTPQHATTDDVLSAAEGFARFIYGVNDLNAAGVTPFPQAGEKVVPLHDHAGEPENHIGAVVGRWEAESGFVAFSSVKANGAVVSFSRDGFARPTLTVSIGGMDIKTPIPEAMISEIIEIFGGGGGETCA